MTSVLSWGYVRYFYNVLDDHMLDYKSSKNSSRHQGSDVSTKKTFSRKKTNRQNSIFSIQAISQLKSLAMIALREYWSLLQSCGVCTLFIWLIFPCACYHVSPLDCLLNVFEYLLRSPQTLWPSSHSFSWQDMESSRKVVFSRHLLVSSSGKDWSWWTWGVQMCSTYSSSSYS